MQLLGSMANDSDNPNNSGARRDPAGGENNAANQENDNVAPPANNNSPARSIFKILVIVGIIGAVVLSYGVQSYNDTYLVPIQEEKTFPLWSDTRYVPIYTAVLPAPDSLLKFVQFLDMSNEINMKLVDGEKFVSAEALDYYDHRKYMHVESFTFKYNHLTTVIKYVYNDSSLDAVFEASGRDPRGVAQNYTLLVAQVNRGDLLIPLTDGAKHYYRFPNKKGEEYPWPEHLDKTIAQREEKWEKTFEGMFQLKKKEMPEVYQDVAQSALSYVQSGYTMNDGIQLRGMYTQNFTHKVKFAYLQSRHTPLKSLDEQAFPVIVLARWINCLKAEQIITSWTDLINELGYAPNRLENGQFVLEDIQDPMLFQSLKEILNIKACVPTYPTILTALEVVAEQTMKNSIGQGGLRDVRWLGHSRGIFQMEPETPKGSSSLELLCLLEDICHVMNEINRRVGRTQNKKWEHMAREFAEAMNKYYWDEENKRYADLENGQFKAGRATHVPLIMSLIAPGAKQLPLSLKNLQEDPLYTATGLQLSEEYGAPIAANFLLTRALKRYSIISSTSQETAHGMYSTLKNNLIAAVARSHRLQKSFYGRFDKDMRPLGPRGDLDGTLVLSLMAE
ncbi:unnamed protein product [Caenorhabditis sp. 36 PRJEB53466]|nr:unnamed protein product [Caenorhabditis sp. 36 PRJEB53466]